MKAWTAWSYCVDFDHLRSPGVFGGQQNTVHGIRRAWNMPMALFQHGTCHKMKPLSLEPSYGQFQLIKRGGFAGPHLRPGVVMFAH